MSNQSVCETFDEAVVRFQKFLIQQGRPSKLVWLEPRDILLSGTRVVYVKLPTPGGREKQARKLYDYGLTQGRGVIFNGMVEIEGATCSNVWVPADDTEAQYALLLPALKLRVATGDYRFVGEAVRSRIRWFFLCLRHREKQKPKHQLF